MANYNLTNQTISSSFQQLLQKDTDSGYLVDGIGENVGDITISGSVSASAFVGDGSGLTNLPIEILPSGVVSGSSQIDYPLISNIPTGIVSSSEQLPAGIVSGSSQLTASYDTRYELSGSVAPLPVGVVSGSSQIIVEDTIGNLSGSRINGTVSNATNAVTASYALNGGVTSIIAGTNVTIDQSQGNVTINSVGGGTLPAGVVSGSSQIDVTQTTNIATLATTGSNTFVGNQTINAGNLEVNGESFKVNLTSTGSTSFQIDRTGVGGLNLSIGGYEGFGGWKTTASQTFYGIDQAFFSAEKDFYIKNLSNGQGSINVWSENDLILRGDTGVVIQGSDPFGPTGVSEDIDIYGAAIATSISSGINGFAYEIFENTRVRGVRAFVETPLQIQVGVTLTVEQYGTLKVINEL